MTFFSSATQVDSTYVKHDTRAQLIVQRVEDAGGGVVGIREGMEELRSAINASSFWTKVTRTKSK